MNRSIVLMRLTTAILAGVGIATLATASFAYDGKAGDREGNRGYHHERAEHGEGMRKMREKRMQEMFEKSDMDGSGDLTLEEFSAEGQDMFANADANEDGQITKEEMQTAIENRMRERSAKMADRMFSRLDTDGDGIITSEESQAMASKRFARMDRDNSGTLEPNEMIRKRGGKEHHRMGKHGMEDGKSAKPQTGQQ
jgi:Ca2+-binding EF-hand superfamily protein